MEPATTDRIQRMIDAEATERFPPDAVPQLALLRHGDHPVIEPGELYLLVILGQDGATRDAWMDEHFGRLEDFRARRVVDDGDEAGVAAAVRHVRAMALCVRGEEEGVGLPDQLALGEQRMQSIHALDWLPGLCRTGLSALAAAGKLPLRVAAYASAMTASDA